ncbi:cytochrome P450 [Streptomyces sp. 3211]|uniref:cytochrome P450 n=1 Tax=Streptomyces sp. 3211 TaxID=1964449 RepID=UPI0016229491|nr:cytochrome P450 [Streptomyces sp. 3211]
MAEQGMQFFTACQRQHGDLFAVQLGNDLLTIVAHPELARHVLRDRRDNYDTKGPGTGFQSSLIPLLQDSFATRTGGDEEWVRQRKLVTRRFTPAAVRSAARATQQVIDRVLDRWEVFADEGQSIDLAKEAPRLALAVVAATTLGVDVSLIQADDLIDAFQDVVDYLWEAIWRASEPAASPPSWLPGPGSIRYRKAIDTINRVVDEICASSYAADEGLVSLLRTLRATGQISEQNSRLLAITNLTAGYESMAASLTFLLHYLCNSPEQLRIVEDSLMLRLFEPPHECTETSKLTRAAVKETLRMASPIFWIQRQATRSDVLGGYAIPAQSLVVVFTHLIHHHELFWENPDHFDASRFLGEPQHPHAWLPFGDGERRCFAEEFAITQGSLFLTRILRRFAIHPVPQSGGCIHMSTNLRLVGRVPVQLVRRPVCPWEQ